jgi:hypothetical protein
MTTVIFAITFAQLQLNKSIFEDKQHLPIWPTVATGGLPLQKLIFVQKITIKAIEQTLNIVK